jgi:hypothetical protein
VLQAAVQQLAILGERRTDECCPGVRLLVEAVQVGGLTMLADWEENERCVLPLLLSSFHVQELLSEWLSPLAVLAEPCLCLDVC